MEQSVAIECVGVTKSFRSGARAVTALRGVDLAVATGSWLAIMGQSGSGKSTLLQLIGGLDVPDEGSIRIGETAIERLSETDRAVLRRRRIGYVFQFFNLIGNLTALGNVELPMLLIGTPRRAARIRALELLDALGIRDTAEAAPADLSGGQQQRVAIARALANRPDVLLADEPTGNLDSASARDVLALLEQHHRAGQTNVMVTHDQHVASAADRIVVVQDGLLVDDRSTNRHIDTRESGAVSPT
jgi:putative ABC transport system ATP-binding protein